MILETRYVKTKDGKTVKADELKLTKAAPCEAETDSTSCNTGTEGSAEDKPEKMNKTKGDEHGKRI
nr:MAG TPA: hypothetical protein [Bacteriophage sp.]